jgi:SAM-dependent methyltransferase
VFQWLAGASPARDLAWDCACGNGQASIPLAEFFDRVIATDASAAQIAEAEPHPRVEYRLAPAEASGLEHASLDLVTVAQAAHWLDAGAFAAEVSRVIKPGGLLAYLTYGLHSIDERVDAVTMRYYTEIVGPYWPPERHHVDEHYRHLPFPLPRIETPSFEIVLGWDLGQLLGYLATWSASKEYVKAHGADPRELVLDDLTRAWGNPAATKVVRWPLTVIAGYAGRSSGS